MTHRSKISEKLLNVIDHNLFRDFNTAIHLYNYLWNEYELELNDIFNTQLINDTDIPDSY